MLPQNLFEFATFRWELCEVSIPKEPTKFFLLLSMLLLSACTDDQPAPPRDNTVWFVSLPSTLTTDTEARINFAWRNILNGRPTRFNLNLLRDGVEWKFLATTTADLSADGSDFFVWDGRMPAASQTAGRRTPVPPGRYSLRMHQPGGVLQDTRDVTIVANGWDSDSDGISNAAEDENSGIGGPVTTISYPPNTFYYNRTLIVFPPLLPTDLAVVNNWYFNRGTYDYSLARGTYNPGTLFNGLRYANESTGYYYNRGGDAEDTDNWGVLLTINSIDGVGRKWRTSHPTGARMRVGDVSRQNGGYWSDHPGGSHQQGLHIDLGYMRTNTNEELPYDFRNESAPFPNYSYSRTRELVDYFIAAGATRIIVDYRAGFTSTTIIELDHPPTAHHHHFHVEFSDPDGTGN